MPQAARRRRRAAEKRRATCSASSYRVLRDVETPVVSVPDVAKLVAVDVEVVQLDRVLAFRRGRAEEANELGTIGVGNVVDGHPAAEPGREDDVLTDEAARVVLVDVVRAKAAPEVEERLGP